MPRIVRFKTRASGLNVAGIEGSVCPIDKMAEVVLSSTAERIAAITCEYEDGTSVTWEIQPDPLA